MPSVPMRSELFESINRMFRLSVEDAEEQVRGTVAPWVADGGGLTPHLNVAFPLMYAQCLRMLRAKRAHDIEGLRAVRADMLRSTFFDACFETGGDAEVRAQIEAEVVAVKHAGLVSVRGRGRPDEGVQRLAGKDDVEEEDDE